MDIRIRLDKIISRAYSKEYAFVEIEKAGKIPYFYKARILTNLFPQELINHINDWTECVNTFTLSLLDEITDEIIVHDLWLSENNMKIFNIKIEGDFITFFTKLPTKDGFIDDYPNY